MLAPPRTRSSSSCSRPESTRYAAAVAEGDTEPGAGLLEWIAEHGLPSSEPRECSYLPGERSSLEGFQADALAGSSYRLLMEQGFRRSGRLFYRNACPDCSACVPLRIPVNAFVLSRSQRRTLRRNADVEVRVSEPQLDDEKRELYRRYLAHQHPGSSQGEDPDGVDEFLYSAVVPSVEVRYQRGGRLLGVSILDVSPRSVSSVYHFFEPEEAQRRLGILSILTEIGLARAWQAEHYYLGFWIAGCGAMDYKADFHPHELLVDGRWVREPGTVLPS